MPETSYRNRRLEALHKTGAALDGVGAKLASDWERGGKRPSGPSLGSPTSIRSKGLDAIA
jgi:hypothetical protein